VAVSWLVATFSFKEQLSWFQTLGLVGADGGGAAQSMTGRAKNFKSQISDFKFGAF
jgi:hypothetical protein